MRNAIDHHGRAPAALVGRFRHQLAAANDNEQPDPPPPAIGMRLPRDMPAIADARAAA